MSSKLKVDDRSKFVVFLLQRQKDRHKNNYKTVIWLSTRFVALFFSFTKISNYRYCWCQICCCILFVFKPVSSIVKMTFDDDNVLKLEATFCPPTIVGGNVVTTWVWCCIWFCICCCCCCCCCGCFFCRFVPFAVDLLLDFCWVCCCRRLLLFLLADFCFTS